MSEPAKAAEAKPAEAKHDAHPPKKDGASPGAKVWGMSGTVLVVLLGLIVLFMLTQSLVPQVFSGFSGTLYALSSGMSQTGSALNQVNMGTSVMMSGAFGLVLKIMFYILGFALAGYFLSVLLAKLKKPKGGEAAH